MNRRENNDAAAPERVRGRRRTTWRPHKGRHSALGCHATLALLLIVGAGCRLGYDEVAGANQDSGPPADGPESNASDAGPEPDADVTVEPDAAPPAGWSSRDDIPYRASALTSVVLSDGLHILGGGNDWFGTIRYQHHYLYEPDTDTWSEAPADVPDVGTSGAKAVAYGDRLYLVGGFQEGARSLRVYDPGDNSWASLPRVPTAYNYGFVAAVAGDFLYVIGGDPNSQTNAAVYKFDLLAEGWSSCANIPRNRGAGSLAGAAVGNRLYVLNGDTAGGGTILQIYDAQADSWSDGPDLGGHFEAAAAVAVADEVYFFGGAVDHDVIPFTARDAVNIYNTTTDTWSSGPTMPVARAWATAQFFRGEFHVIGGLDGDNTAFAVHEVLRP